MANQKISELNEVVHPFRTDKLAVVNNAETKHISVENIAKFAPTASFLTNATYSSNTFTFTKGDHTTFTRTIGNPLTGASTSANIITFTRADGTTFTRTIAEPAGGWSTPTPSPSPSVAALNTFTGSANTRINSLSNATSSYLTSYASGTVSSSAQIQSVIDDDYISASAATSGFGTGGSSVSDFPFTGSAIISGSLDITGPLSITGFSNVSASLASATGGAGASQSDINASTASLLNTASVNSNVVTFTKGDGTTFNITVDTGSSMLYSDLADLNTFTGSANTRLNSLSNATSSYALSANVVANSSTSSFLTSVDAGTVSSSAQTIANLPTGTVSGSTQIESVIDDNYISASAATSGFGSGGSGAVSDFPFTGSAIVSGSLIITGSTTVSGSVTADEFVVGNAGVGTPTISSNTNIHLSASNAVVVQNGAFRLAQYTNAQTASITAQDGDMIWNTDRVAFMGYSGSAWHAFSLV